MVTMGSAESARPCASASALRRRVTGASPRRSATIHHLLAQSTLPMNTLRWVLLIATEIIFWLGLITFFTLRYGLKRPDLSRLVILLVILTYMLIWGRKDLARLDSWVARRVQLWQRGREQRSV